jgi:hypothetical protein
MARRRFKSRYRRSLSQRYIGGMRRVGRGIRRVRTYGRKRYSSRKNVAIDTTTLALIGVGAYMLMKK